MKTRLRNGAAFAALALLAACGGNGHAGDGLLKPKSAGVPSRGYYKVGAPYEIDGVTYVPAEDYNYDETGIASWYGPDFHGKVTANGELYDMNEVTAAHKTLPMPSLVRVTNLDNGREIIVRVNDRGPYARGRILDMSRRGAQLLGFEKVGTAKVRVQIMARESMILAAAAKQGQLAVDLAGLDNQAPPLPDSTPTYIRPGTVPTPQYQPGVAQPTYRAPAQPQPATQQGPIQLAQAQPTPVETQPLPAPIYRTIPPAPPQGGKAPPPHYTLQPPPGAVAVVDEKAMIQRDLPGDAAKGTDVGGLYLPKPQVVAYQKVRPSGIYIQAGAFGVAENAQRLQQKLAGVGKTDVSTAVVEGKTFYRVRVGPVATVDMADALLNKVVAAGANGAKIVVN